MQIQREDANGDLYQMSLYSSGLLFGQSPRQRARREKETSAAKQEINRRQRQWRLMQQLHANFKVWRDLFVCLTYAEVPKDAGRCLARFHALARKAFARLGIEYKYIAVTEEHDMDGEPVRVHHHLVIPGMGTSRIFAAVRECWPFGTVDCRRLEEGEEMFFELAGYLLKNDRYLPKGARRYSTSRNLKPPAEPVRLRLPETECGAVPPGVAVIRHDVHGNQYGRYEILIGRIYDHAAFDAYWAAQRKRARPDPWERLARRRRGQTCRWQV